MTLDELAPLDLYAGSHRPGSTHWLPITGQPGYGIGRLPVAWPADTRDCNWRRRCCVCREPVVLVYTIGRVAYDGWYQQGDICAPCAAAMLGLVVDVEPALPLVYAQGSLL